MPPAKKYPALFSRIDSPVGPLDLLSYRGSLCLVLFASKYEDDYAQRWLSRFIPGVEIITDQKAHAQYHKELEEYFSGKRKRFSSKLHFFGTDFQLQVWTALRSIPFGETRSYKSIAFMIGNPSATRAVGAAIGRNPISIIVPCHRVIGSNGNMVGFGGGIERKKKLLQLEGAIIM